MRAYSLDLRQRIVEAYDLGEGSVRELAERFAVAPNTVQRYLTRRRVTATVAPASHGGGPRRLLHSADERALRALVAEQNDRTDAEYAARLATATGCQASRRTICRAWRRLGFTRKKKTLHATERDRPDVQRMRRAFRCRARRAQVRGRRFLFLDEFGTHLGLTRRYARAPRGQRAVGAVPNNPDPNVTLTLTLGPDGVVTADAFEDATNGERFTDYVRDTLGPELRPGDIVVADRLGAHRAQAARDAIEARGATYVLLPPYSPDLNPVEEAGAKVKAAVRAANPRTVDALYAALVDAVHAVTPEDAAGWFADRAAYLTDRNHPVRPTL